MERYNIIGSNLAPVSVRIKQLKAEGYTLDKLHYSKSYITVSMSRPYID